MRRTTTGALEDTSKVAIGGALWQPRVVAEVQGFGRFLGRRPGLARDGVLRLCRDGSSGSARFTGASVIGPTRRKSRILRKKPGPRYRLGLPLVGSRPGSSRFRGGYQ